MFERLKRPTDPYDPAWVEFRRQNPGLRLSLSAGATGEDGGEGGNGGDGGDGGDGAGAQTVDLASFVPENFKGADGKFDTAAFRSNWDELTSFKAQADEAKSALPQSADAYEFKLPENFALPEGFDPEALAHTDEEGNKVEFDVHKMIDPADPDVKLLQAALHEAGASQELMSKLVGIVVGRELRAVSSAQSGAQDQIKALGPEGKARIDTVTRSIEAKLPKEQASAVLDGITSADALRGVEALLKDSKAPIPSAPGHQDLRGMSIDERLQLGLKQRDSAK